MLFPSGAQWFNFRNDSGETIPAFGVVRIQDAGIVDGNRLVLSATKPDDYGSQYLHYINGGSEVAADAFGSCALATGPVWARFTGGAPSPGQWCGPTSNSFDLRQHVGGFQAVGAEEDGRILVVQSPLLLAFGKIVNDDIPKGGTGIVRIYHGPIGNEFDSGFSVTGVLNRVKRMSVADPVHVKFTPNGLAIGQVAKELSPAEC